KTVIAKSSVLAFGRPLYREGLLSRSALLRSIYGQTVYRLTGADEARMERARRSMLSITRGWEQARVRDIVRDTFEKIVAPIIYGEALQLFSEHHAAGRKVFLVSSSPIEIVSSFAEHLGADECIASRSSSAAGCRRRRPLPRPPSAVFSPPSGWAWPAGGGPSADRGSPSGAAGEAGSTAAGPPADAARDARPPVRVAPRAPYPGQAG